MITFTISLLVSKMIKKFFYCFTEAAHLIEYALHKIFTICYDNTKLWISLNNVILRFLLVENSQNCEGIYYMKD